MFKPFVVDLCDFISSSFTAWGQGHIASLVSSWIWRKTLNKILIGAALYTVAKYRSVIKIMLNDRNASVTKRLIEINFKITGDLVAKPSNMLSRVYYCELVCERPILPYAISLLLDFTRKVTVSIWQIKPLYIS